MNQQDTSCSDDRLLSLLQLDEDGDDNQLSANHIAECQRCQSRLEQLAAEPGEWQDIRDSLLADDELDVVANSSLDNDLIDNRPWARERWRRATAWSDSMAKSLLAEAGHPEMLGRIGRYDVERLIGSGGMGVVFKAYDTELNRPVAVKLLAPYLAGSGAARKRFAREARAAAAVVDDHVVPIHNVETNDEHPFLVMKYIAGGSLQQRLDREGPLEVCEVLRIGIHTAKGLAAAHAQGLIHRDVKPSNILLDEGVERALLTDFGLARATDDASLTRSGFHPGTPHYMSPEQVCGEAIDARSDLFGLGCVLYALCTGHPPFRSETSYAVLRRITDDTPRSIRETNPDVPIWLEQIVMKLLAKSPDERFESAESVAELLEDCLAHVQNPTSTPLPEPVAKLVKSFGVCGNDMRADSLDDVRYPPIGKFIAAAAFAFALVLAGVLIVLELNKGTLTIQCDADDVPIRIMQLDDVVEKLTVSKAGASVRVAAGKYVVEIDGQTNGITVELGTVTLQRGGREIVRIVKEEHAPSVSDKVDAAGDNVREVLGSSREIVKTMLIHVVDEQGKPIRKATVFRNHVYAPGESQPHKIENAKFETDANGTTVISLTGTPHDLRLWATRDGYCPLHAMWAKMFQADGDTIPGEFTFVMRRGTTIGGIVVDAKGRPIPDVRVEVRDLTVEDHNINPKHPGKRPVGANMLAEGDTVVTNAAGRWEMNNVPPDDVLLAGHAHDLGDLDKPAQTKPLLNLRFLHPRYEERQWEVPQQKHDITLDSLRDKAAKVVLPSKQGSVEGGSAEEEKAPGVDGKSTQQHAPSSPSTIDYRGLCVRAEDGVPIAGAVARFFVRGNQRSPMRLFEMTTTDKDGHFRIDCKIPNGTEVDLALCRIAITATGRASRSFSWQQSSDLTRIEMQPSASLKGRVTDSASRPVAGASVRLGPNRLPGVHDAVTDQDGQYEIADLEQADELSYESGISNVVQVEHPEYAATTARVESIPSTVNVVLKETMETTREVVSGDVTPEAPLLDRDGARALCETRRRRWQLLDQAYRQGEVSLREVLTAAQNLAEAEVAAAESSDERRQAGQRLVDVLKQLKTTVEMLYKSADAGEADVLAVEAELQKAQAQLRKAQADERKLLDHFSRLRTLDAVTSAYNESTQQMRLELFDPPIPDLTSEQMRTAMLDAANVYRKKGQLSIASALEQSVEKDSLPHGLTFGGTMGTASQTFRQVLPGLTFENGPGQHTVVFLTKAELRYSRNGWSSSTWGDIHPPLTGNWELVSINQQDNTLAPASFSQWKQQHASWTTIVIDDSTLSTIGDDVAVYDLTVDYHSGPLPAFRLSQKGEVKHEGVLMGNGFVDDTSLQIAIDIDGKSTPTTFNTDGDRTTRLKYRRVQKEPQQTKAMPEREQGEERNDAELSTPQATLNYLHRRSFADRADFPAERYTDEALLDLSGMLLQNLVMMSGLSQIGAQTGGLLGMDDGVPVVSGGPASFHLQVDALLEKHKEKNPPEVSTKAFELLAKLTLGAVFSEEESLVTPDRQLIRMAAEILRSPKEFIPAASRLVESFGDGSEEDEAKEKNKPAPTYNITIDGDNATATQAGEAEAAESQMPPTIKLRRVNERWLIDQILSDDDLAAMQRSIQDVLGDGLFESEKPGKAAEAKMAGDASLADDQRHLVWENANIVHLGQSFAETLGLDEGSRAAINSLLTEMWTKYIELECEHTEYSRTHDGKLQADVGKFSEARDRLTHEFWMKLGEIVPASAREHIFALASAGSQETPSLLGWQEPFYPARVQIRSNGTGFHWYVRPGKHGITGDGKTLPFELAHYLTLGQQNLDGDKRVVPAGTASPPDVSIETGD